MMKRAASRPRSVVWRLLRFAQPYHVQLAACLALSLIAVPLSLLTPLPLRLAVDHVLGTAPLTGWLAEVLPGSYARSGSALLAVAVGMIIVTTVLLQLQSVVRWLLETYTGKKLVLAFRARLFRHAQRLSLAYHDRAGTADSAYRIQYDAPAIEHVLVTGAIPLLTSALTLVGMIVVTLQIDALLALVALGVTPVIFALMIVFSRRLKERWTEVWNLDSRALAVVQEALSSLRLVKAFGTEDVEQRRFVRQSGDVVRKHVDVAVVHGGYDVLVALTLAIGSGAGLYIGVQHVQAGILSLGQLLMVMAYLAMLYEPLSTLSAKVADLQSALASGERAFAVLDQMPDVVEHDHPRPIARAEGRVEFRKVNFAYGDRGDVLHDVSFAVSSGARVAIEGATGAGKTTLLSLLARFYDPSAGQIMVDGVDLRDYRVDDLRRQFSIVQQEPVLFSTTLAENIGYGREGATRDEVLRAAQLANAHDFICALPQGYDTLVGERGMQLSGGERQRVALARAFLRDAPVLLLDEPTSALDEATETRIIEATERLMRDRTTFIVAHRPSTLKHCDVRLRVVSGSVVAVLDEPKVRLPEVVAAEEMPLPGARLPYGRGGIPPEPRTLTRAAGCMRIVVVGTLGGEPYAGTAWQAMQIVLGFLRLGHDAWYFEVTSTWPYDPTRQSRVADGEYAIAHVARVARRFGIEERWAYYRGYGTSAGSDCSASKPRLCSPRPTSCSTCRVPRCSPGKRSPRDAWFSTERTR